MSHPRLKLVIALCLSVAVGVAVDRSREGPAEGLGLAFGVVLAGLALARWLPAVVSLSSPGRRLIVFLVVDFLVAGYVVSLSSAEEQESLSFVAAAIGVLAAGAAVYWWLPRWQATRWPITIEDKDRVELEDKARATVAQLLGGLGLIATVAITLYSVNQARVAADRTLRTTERDQAAARFSRAIEQLAAKSESKPATVVRLGAIYALEQYALQDAPRGDCVEGEPCREDEIVRARKSAATVLAAYVRSNAPNDARGTVVAAPAPPQDCGYFRAPDSARPARLAADVAAALDVLGRLYSVADASTRGHLDPHEYLPPLDLSASDLRGADLSGFTLNSANFAGSTLAGADLSNSSLWESLARGPHGSVGALLHGVDLRNACLTGAVGLDRTVSARTNLAGAVICDRSGRRIKRWISRGATCPEG